MTDINPTPSWAAVRQLEIGEFALGGANGNMNEQAKSLAARSEFLKQRAAYQYNTMSEANADIANIAVNQNVNVVDSGLYYKATAGATSLTKSAYDPLTKAKTYADGVSNNALTESKFYTDTVSKNTADYYETKNVFNTAQESAVGYYVNGIPNGIAGHISALDYYAVQPLQKFWIRGATGADIIAVYDADKNYIGKINYTSAVNGILTVAATYSSNKIPAFIRISAYNKTVLTGIEFGIGDLLPPQVLAYNAKYSIVRNSTFSSAVAAAVFSASDVNFKTASEQVSFNLYDNHLVVFRNLINPNQTFQQGYYTNSGIQALPTSPNFYVSTEFLPISLNRKFWVKGVVGQLLQLCDINKKPVQALYSDVIVNGIYTVPATAGASNTPIYYIRVGTHLGLDAVTDGRFGVGWANDFGEVPSVIPVYSVDTAKLSSSLLTNISNNLGGISPLTGKKWAAIGDSITTNDYASKIYCQVLSEKYSATVTKYSQSGACLHKQSAEATALVLADIYSTIPLDNPPDIITIAGGTNDPVKISGVDHLGTMADRTNTTIYGALHVLLSGLRGRFPNARIGFIAPLVKSVRYIDGDITNAEYAKYKAIREVCAYYSVPVWNGNTEFGASPLDNAEWKTTYMSDGLHPTNAGHIWFANRLENFILSLAK